MRAPYRGVMHLLAAAVTLFALLTAMLAQATPAQSSSSGIAPKNDPDVQHAYELYQQGKQAQAAPLFEQLCAKYPKDNALWEAWGVTTLSYSQTLTDPDLRKQTRVLARSRLVKARELGDNSNLLQILLNMIPEDGSQGTNSPRKEVNDAMQQAEADFARGDYDKAREGYLQVLLLDPKNYSAALFIGDVYFKQHINGSAGEWFAKAIEIDPDQETAYRYWGDALWAMNKSSEAREKYIQAIVANPYTNRSWIGLNQWAGRAKVTLNWVKLQDKSAVTQKDKNVTITLDNSLKDDLNGAAWTAYGLNRALWQGDKFKKEFPNEPKYRRTMREEADCLHMMVSAMAGQKDFEKKTKDLDPALLQLIQIDQAGFLEPFTLLNRVDNDIAKDYVPYRAEHRDIIYRYLDEYVVPKAPQP